LEIKIVKGYLPGSIGRITEMHSRYYHAGWKFGLFFEAKVAAEIAEFLGNYDDQRDGFWIATSSVQVEGSIVIDGRRADDEGAHLRWFILSDGFRAKGIGNQLIHTAVEFCHQQHYPRVYLWTFEGLFAARHLYEKTGFRLVDQHRGNQWGTEVVEQRFELRLT